MYLTREDDKTVRWWNVVGLALFVAFLLVQFIYEPDYRTVSAWGLPLLGLLGVALMPPGARLKRGQRPPAAKAAHGD